MIFIGIALLVAIGLALLISADAGSLVGLTQVQTAQLIPLLVLGIRLLEREADWGRWLAYIAAFVLIGRAVMIYSPGVTRFFASHYMFGALLLWALLALELWGRRRRTAVEQGAV